MLLCSLQCLLLRPDGDHWWSTPGPSHPVVFPVFVSKFFCSRVLLNTGNLQSSRKVLGVFSRSVPPSSPEGGADLDLSSGFGFHWSHQLVELTGQLLSLVYELESEPEVKAQEVGIIV